VLFACEKEVDRKQQSKTGRVVLGSREDQFSQKAGPNLFGRTAMETGRRTALLVFFG